MMIPMPDFLARIQLYRLTLYYLIVQLAAALAFCVFGILPYSAIDLVFSTLLILAVCWSVNWAFAKVFGATSSLVSVLITGLILALIITPFAPTQTRAVSFAAFAAAWAMACKYIFALHRKHIFNPAAFGVALAGLAVGPTVSWWIGGSLYFLPIALAGGLLILRKQRSLDLVLAFSASALVTIALSSGLKFAWDSVQSVVLHSMFCFFAFVMLTEPKTVPLGRPRRLIYAAIIGVLFAPETHLGSYYFAPEVALLAGNLFAILASPRRWMRRSVPLRRDIARPSLSVS
jgi:glycine betaine catabolism B